MIPRTSTAEVIKLAPGIPETENPTPASKACKIEMPTTPLDTFRIVAPASATKCSPRPDASLSENCRTDAINLGAGANRNPETTMAAKKLSMPAPASAAIAKRLPPSGFSCGAIFASAACRLVEASCQNW